MRTLNRHALLWGSTSLVLKFADGVRAVEEQTPESPDLKPLPMSGQEVTFELPPGRMKMVRLRM